MAEPKALPDPPPEQLADAARIDAVEGTSEATGVVEGQASEGELGTFPREYVEQLRRENVDRRKRAEVVADGRLADPADLLDGADATALLGDDGRKPHYAKRISGDVGQGARPGRPQRGAVGDHPVPDTLVPRQATFALLTISEATIAGVAVPSGDVAAAHACLLGRAAALMTTVQARRRPSTAR